MVRQDRAHQGWAERRHLLQAPPPIRANTPSNVRKVQYPPTASSTAILLHLSTERIGPEQRRLCLYKPHPSTELNSSAQQFTFFIQNCRSFRPTISQTWLLDFTHHHQHVVFCLTQARCPQREICSDQTLD